MKDLLPHFSKECLTLAEEMAAEGWTFRRTKKGEAFAKSPDGTAAATLARKDQKRGLKNARARFNRWKRMHSGG